MGVVVSSSSVSVSWINSGPLDLQDRFLLASHGFQDSSPLGVSTGNLDMASATRCFFPGTWTTLSLRRRVFCLRFRILGFSISPSSLSVLRGVVLPSSRDLIPFLMVLGI